MGLIAGRPKLSNFIPRRITLVIIHHSLFVVCGNARAEIGNYSLYRGLQRLKTYLAEKTLSLELEVATWKTSLFAVAAGNEETEEAATAAGKSKAAEDDDTDVIAVTVLEGELLRRSCCCCCCLPLKR